MNLQDRIESYTVTAVPGRDRLRLLWSVASELTLDSGEDEPDAAPVEPTAEVGRAAPISLLDSYRITRVPARAAS